MIIFPPPNPAVGWGRMEPMEILRSASATAGFILTTCPVGRLATGVMSGALVSCWNTLHEDRTL
ncbi:hypothetical protein DRO38_06875 [Candidatus Bathyarchaeota archaeon]|nr:MAG: hypothetical protein DRO38_06875 [Candidatus Bathyarchaeota archaeon]